MQESIKQRKGKDPNQTVRKRDEREFKWGRWTWERERATESERADKSKQTSMTRGRVTRASESVQASEREKGYSTFKWQRILQFSIFG